MLKSILLVEESNRTISMHSLQQNCRTLHRAATPADAKEFISVVDAAVLHVPQPKLNEWQSTLSGMRKLPIIWLCSENAAPKEIDWGFALDGILFSSMNSIEMQYALKWSLRVFQQRKRWADERDGLLQRLEERKWIDQAKTVLCEIKGISEAEAYDFLRKQAMNERKRIGDIAASIVKVYQLIHG
ncbi:ANTAR domain-containing protein [Paenibacillus oenotherae]|uniref:ANTAR domain-containing protein n=1 Tax=Paenibacillus oenotherae TaxID=1435645 RepID=A0ABS7D7I7_9BACL|nr:ANTAR domain-containing protein [Paenibacillus oenotherae]MBW7475133.1 ANTAR domain-containing protein [Paenibacillus oenotherae]